MSYYDWQQQSSYDSANGDTGESGGDTGNIVADQLARQLDYSNSLLMQVQALESEQLKLRREFFLSQENSKKYGQENDRLKHELSEHRKKVLLAQDLKILSLLFMMLANFIGFKLKSLSTTRNCIQKILGL